MGLRAKRWMVIGLQAVWFGMMTVSAASIDTVLQLVPVDGSANRLSLRVETDLASDSDTSDASGYLDATLDVHFDPTTREGEIVGITFHESTPGTVQFTDMSFSFLFGLLRATTSGMRATARTPAPPGPVAEEQFPVENHRVVLNAGVLQASGMVSETVDLAAAPMESTATNGLAGELSLSPPVIDGEEVTYVVTLELPLAIDQTMDADGTQVRVIGSGTIRAEGTVTRPLTPPDDGDGVPADWETARGTDPEVNDGALDPDEDGVSNYGEYVSDTDPRDKTSYPRLDAVPGDAGELRFQFAGRAGRLYRIETASRPTGAPWAVIREYRPRQAGLAELRVTTGTSRSGWYRLRISMAN